MDDLEEMLRELSEKYKNSKSVEVYEEQLEWWFKIIDDLREENKKLKLENADLMWERDGLKMVVEKLKEENQTLELWLDNKEKLNEEYRKLIWKIDQLEEENENLRKDLFHLTNNGKAK